MQTLLTLCDYSPLQTLVKQKIMCIRITLKAWIILANNKYIGSKYFEP